MKSLAILLAAALAVCGALAQGTVTFANVGVGLNAPFFDSAGTPLGADFLAQLFVGTGDNESLLTPVPGPTSFLFGSGYFNGGTRELQGFLPGSRPFFEVRAWDSSAGHNYEAALASGKTALKTSVFQIGMDLGDNAGRPPTLPAALIGMTGIGTRLSDPPVTPPAGQTELPPPAGSGANNSESIPPSPAPQPATSGENNAPGVERILGSISEPPPVPPAPPAPPVPSPLPPIPIPADVEEVVILTLAGGRFDGSPIQVPVLPTETVDPGGFILFAGSEAASVRSVETAAIPTFSPPPFVPVVPTPAIESGTVPEPSAIALSATAAFLWLLARRKL